MGVAIKIPSMLAVNKVPMIFHRVLKSLSFQLANVETPDNLVDFPNIRK